MRRFWLWILIFAFVFTAFEDEAEARRRRRRPPKRRQPIINEKKLYERMGGDKMLRQIVDEWTRMNIGDARIASIFATTIEKPERLVRLRRSLSDQLCELADGPCVYKAPDMKKAREPQPIGEMEFLVFSDNLFRAMQKYGVPEREKNELLARVGEVKSDIVREIPAFVGESDRSAGAQSATQTAPPASMAPAKASEPEASKPKN